MKSTTRAALGVAVLAAGLFALVYLRRSSTPETPPAAAPRPLNLAKIMDEGSLTRESPEEEFLRLAAAAPPAQPLNVDLGDLPGETRRVIAGLTGLFRRMKASADAYKKTDPARYAAEMQALKAELSAWMDMARKLCKAWDGAGDEILRALKEEADPVVKERLGYLLRFLKPEAAGSAALSLAQSGLAPERKVGITILAEVRTLDSVNALVHRASADPDVDLQRRAIVGLGKTLGYGSPTYEKYAPAAFDALRQYLQPSSAAPLRAAAFDALSFPVRLSEQDKSLFMTALQSEKDPEARKAAEHAYRRMSARRESATERANRGSSTP